MSKTNVLLVDDHAVVRAGFKLLLTAASPHFNVQQRIQEASLFIIKTNSASAITTALVVTM